MLKFLEDKYTKLEAEYKKQSAVFREFCRGFEVHKKKRENLDRKSWVDRKERMFKFGNFYSKEAEDPGDLENQETTTATAGGGTGSGSDREDHTKGLCNSP